MTAKSRSFESSLAGMRGLLFVVAGIFAGSAVAQDVAPAWLDVAIVRAKPGQNADLEDRIRELLQAQQDSGQTVSQVFEVAAGNPGEYHIVTPIVALAMNDNPVPPMPPAEMAAWVARIVQHIDSARFFYARLYPDHAIQTEAGNSAPMLLLQTVRVIAGKDAEYETWLSEDVLPALRESNAIGHTLSRGAFGDSPQNYYHAIAVENWASLDGPNPLMQHLGQRGYEQLMDGADDIVESISLTLASVRSDLMPGN